MSHRQLRKEKDCLNCGTIVQGKYCHICGQENVEPKEGFWHLVQHFFYDITHFDSRLFDSLRYILFRPGFLPKEYLQGRRVRYVNPVQLYVFMSAFFFLIFFTFSPHGEDIIDIKVRDINGKTLEDIAIMDSTEFAAFTATINKNDKKPAVPMTREQFRNYIDSEAIYSGIHFTSSSYRSKAAYDSLLATGVKKHNWLERQLIYKELALNEKYHNNKKLLIATIRDTFIHHLPQILFISLPLFALLLRLLYVRRKELYYISHAIFTIYLYIFLFFVFLVLFGVSKLDNYLHWPVFAYVKLILIASIFFYEYKAMRNFYKQGRLKTIFKWFLLNFLFGIVVALLFVILIFFSLFQI
jgi:hypothetical protein